MQYLTAAALTLAIGASAVPHWSFPRNGYVGAAAPGHGAPSAPTASGIAFPSGTSPVALPTATGSVGALSSISNKAAADDGDDSDEDDDDGDNDDDESGSSSSTLSYSNSTVTSSATVSDSTAASGGSLPASSGTSVLDAVQTIVAGGSFDGGMVMFDRGVSCSGQSEGGDSDAVFEIEEGGTLSNVIIGPNQAEGVHCFGACTLNNVWWSAVCEDAFTIKEQDAGDTTTITGGGAFGAVSLLATHTFNGTC